MGYSRCAGGHPDWENHSRRADGLGTPAREIGKFKEAYAWYARLPELGARIKELELKCGARERKELTTEGAEEEGEVETHAVADYCRRRAHPKYREDPACL